MGRLHLYVADSWPTRTSPDKIFYNNCICLVNFKQHIKRVAKKSQSEKMVTSERVGS